MNHHSAKRRTCSVLAVVAAATAALSLGAPPASAAEGPPRVSVDLPPLNRSGWYQQSPTAALSVETDQGLREGTWTLEHAGTSSSGALDESGAAVLIPGEGRSTLRWTATSTGGRTTRGSVDVDVDTVAPVVTSTTPAEVDLGAVVTASTQCTDATSGISSCEVHTGSPGQALDTSTPGRWQFVVVGRDVAGNETSTAFAYRVVAPDTTAPVAEATFTSGSAPVGGWYRSSVYLHLTASDRPGAEHERVSGVAGMRVQVGDDPAAEWATDETPMGFYEDGTTVVRWSARDNAGNRSVEQELHVAIDTQRPRIEATYPVDGQHLALGSTDVPVFSCSDKTSGVAVCSAGSALETDVAGEHRVDLYARDHAGHLTVSSVRYVVDPPVGPTPPTETPTPTPPVRDTPPTAVEPPRSTRSPTTVSPALRVRPRGGSGRLSATVTVVAPVAVPGRFVVLDGRRTIARGAATASPSGTDVRARLARLAPGRHVLRVRFTPIAPGTTTTSRPVVIAVPRGSAR